MSNENQPDAQPGAEAGDNRAQFSLQKIYVKDLSFESPRPLELFSQNIDKGPEINLQLDTHTNKVGDSDHYEVTLDLTITAKEKDSDKVYYLIELKQSGVFKVTNFPPQELSAMLNAFCPSILFPYAREAVSNIVERGGFPQLLLAPINFDALYQQHLAKIKQASEEKQEPTH